MAIAITDEQQEMARVARAFLTGNNVRAASRDLLEAPEDKLPEFWKDLTELGWTGIHLPEEFGGSGGSLQELVVLVEETGYCLAPGPFLPTVWASSVVSLLADVSLKSDVLPGLANGSVIGAVGIGGDLKRADDGTIEGDASLVLSGELANIIILKVGNDMVVVDREQDGVSIKNLVNIDPSRRVAQVKCSGVKVDSTHVLTNGYSVALRLGRTLAAAEASGGAHACTDMAVAYALVREQFGRTIAHFQAVKHHCANMRVAAECSTAAAWDAARAEPEDRQAEFASVVAASLAMPAFRLCGQLNTQVHGGIGYTWEHDAHLYIRRSSALSALFDADQAKLDLANLCKDKVKRSYSIELPPEAEKYRVKARKFIDELSSVAKDAKRKTLSHSGYLVPHWPKPWGIEASPIEQLVIDQEFKAANISVPNLGISGWNILTIAQHGSPEQLDRWIRQGLDGEFEFCQLFSEPNAGSDAAAIQSRGTKVDGGWKVNGQKVWTSGAMDCTHGFMTVRTDTKAAKHDGITMMVIDMKGKGVDIRPLIQVTGMSHFNEIFFDDVFVPDENVVGPINGGWAVARATLGNEKVSIGGGMDFAKMSGVNIISLLKKYAAEDQGLAREFAVLTANDVANKLINLRSVARAVSGAGPGKEGNITKLLGAEHAVNTADLACRIVGENTAVMNGDGMLPAIMLLGARAMTIAGGTSEVIRNQIAERILDMPRDLLINN
ncbi:MAG: acyl-CoA dehydrogenase [Pseudomonadales bacterium]|nr:acyl-CoA dehydrogenase [Pseudomonadales bacterium]